MDLVTRRTAERPAGARLRCRSRSGLDDLGRQLPKGSESSAREHLAPYQRVRRIEFFELPKTISGKIRRVDLRGREEKAAMGETAVAEWRDDQFPELRG